MLRRDVLICLLLGGITLAVFWPVRQFDLVYFDDPLVLKDCPEVQAGLTWAGIKWAFTSIVIANWHPVTNLSFLAVSQFFGNTPGAHHLANAFIHAANAVLLFLLLARLTGVTWRSATTAAIFAWHPLRVESVAWIIERKDVLCVFFFLLSLLAYVRYAQRQADNHHSPARFLPAGLGLALLAFALALMSKPMAVTLPFILLLLDVWPLKRFASLGSTAALASHSGQPPVTVRSLLLEKWPFFALTVIFCLATMLIQHNHAAMTPWNELGLGSRIANAISSYTAYPAKLFWPSHLAVIYPFPDSYDLGPTILKAMLLLAISLGCLTQLVNRPWLAVGWFWYLVMALPIIGIVQVGDQAMADRYTYLPLIGPVTALVWTVAEMFGHGRGGKIFLTVATSLILLALLTLTARQLPVWRNTLVLFEQDVAVTPGNAPGFFGLGLAEHSGETNRAIVCYRVASQLDPALGQNRRNLASLLASQDHLAAAENEYVQILTRDPGDVASHLALSSLLADQGHTDESVFQLEAAVRLDPDCIEALNNLAWTLATSPQSHIREGRRAVMLAEHACELTHYQKTIFIGTLAAAYAEAGQFDDAVATAQQACDLARKNGQKALLQKNQELLEQYRQHKTVRE